MSVTFELPADVEERLRAETPNFEAEAKEAVLVEMYRQEKLTRYELAQALGMERLEVDAVLKKHKVTIDLPTAEEMEQQLRWLREAIRK
jgi:hypothetical protein